MTRTRSLFKYFTEQRWADAFLEGKILFRSLAYFRDYEDTKVRGDRNEGISIYRPEGGLLINNHTQGKSFTIPDAAFEVVTNQEEIFVYCLSRSLTDGLRERFESVACVEILKPPNFCERIKKALQAEAIFVAGRVEYYCQNDPPNPRWALPDRISLSKEESYRWQNEFRLSLTVTDAFGFEKGSHRIVLGKPETPKAAEHQEHQVEVGSLRDICRLHLF
jgi:hypothetical protein